MSNFWLRSRFEEIFEKYGDPNLSSDEISLKTGEVVTDNGHIQAIGSRHVEDAAEGLADTRMSSSCEDLGQQHQGIRHFYGNYTRDIPGQPVADAIPSLLHCPSALSVWRCPRSKAAGSGADRTVPWRQLPSPCQHASNQKNTVQTSFVDGERSN